jgi:hypothetical protein
MAPAADEALATPYGECAVSHWSSTRNLDDQRGVPSALCTVNWKPRLGANAAMGWNLRAGWHDAMGAGTAASRMREAYLDIDRGDLSLRVGRQIIAWGRADRINPTDSLSPRDFTLLQPDDEDQRNGLDAVRARYALTPSLSLSAIGARFGANVVPQGSLPANLARASNPGQSEWALKLDHNGDGVDWSVSYFDGFERSARYRLDLAQPLAPLFRGAFERTRKAGLDFASAHGAWTLRGEASHARQGCAACAPEQRTVSRMIVGIDRDFAASANLGLQLFRTRRSGYAAPAALPAPLRPLAEGLDRLNSEYGPQQSGITLRLSDRAFNDRLRWEVSAVREFSNKSALLRPRISFAFSDSVRLSAGIDWYSGPAQSQFGALVKNRLNYVMLSLVF